MIEVRKVLLSANPAGGHTVPLLSIGLAARAAGADVRLLTGPGFREHSPLPVLEAGPSWAQLSAENARRHPGGLGSGAPAAKISPAEVGDFFGATRLEMAAEEAVGAARAFAPDIVIAEEADVLGPFAAALMSIPWASHGLAAPLPAVFADAIASATAPSYRRSSVAPTRRVAYIDPWPDMLADLNCFPASDRIQIALSPLSTLGFEAVPVSTSRLAHRRVLVTFGTMVYEPEALDAVLEAIVEANENVNVVALRGAVEEIGFTHDRVTSLRFTPIGDLLASVDAVIAAGGAGTVLASMRCGLPMVILPFFPSHHWISAQLVAVGSAKVITRPTEAGAAVRELLENREYAAAAQRTCDALNAMPSPGEAFEALRIRAVAQSWREPPPDGLTPLG